MPRNSIGAAVERAEYENRRRIDVLKQVLQQATKNVPVTTRPERIRKAIQRPATRAPVETGVSNRINPRSGRDIISLSSRRQCLKAKAVRRAVLLSQGRVNKPGGAPGPYKKRSKC